MTPTPPDANPTVEAQEQPVAALHVRALRLDVDGDLLDFAPDGSDLTTWLGPDLQVVGWGTALRLEFSGPRAMRDAARTWQAQVAATVVDGPSGPLQWPVALASFGFAAATVGYVLVPAVTLVRKDGNTWVVTASSSDAPDPAASLPPSPTTPTAPSGLWTEPGRMTQGKWKDGVRRLTRMLQSGAASKVVMARDIVVSSPMTIDQRYLVDQLRERYPTTWVYDVEGLVGATPEMLAALRQGKFVSRVLAGTSAPGEGETLLASVKNRTEHHLAVESVARALAPLARQMSVPTEPSLLDLPNVTHLSTEVEATVTEGNVLDIIDALHPTAAVCGTPTSLAFDILEDIEGTQRGRYSGPVGWVDGAGDGEFGIALRCGQISEDGHQIRVFAGGGIMPDSIPDLELAETRAKMRPVLQALGMED